MKAEIPVSRAKAGTLLDGAIVPTSAGSITVSSAPHMKFVANQ